MLTDESASDEFCSIIRLRTGFILETDYPSEKDNPSRRIIRLQYKFGQWVYCMPPPPPPKKKKKKKKKAQRMQKHRILTLPTWLWKVMKFQERLIKHYKWFADVFIDVIP